MGCTEEGCEKPKQHIVEEMGLQVPELPTLCLSRLSTTPPHLTRPCWGSGGKRAFSQSHPAPVREASPWHA
eukprot:12464744-Alexandrium_andersonii.AAC.1